MPRALPTVFLVAALGLVASLTAWRLASLGHPVIALGGGGSGQGIGSVSSGVSEGMLELTQLLVPLIAFGGWSGAWRRRARSS